jgi:branched-chain amino acid transport system permease protein
MPHLRRMLPLTILAVLVVTVQVAASASGRDYYLTQATMAAYYTVVALGLSLLMGYAGQVSLGHGAFFALGGYTSAVLTTHGISPGWAFLAALLSAFVAAVLIGFPALRLRGHYLAMATLGFGLIIYRLVLGSNLTGAADGINAVPPWKLVGSFAICGQRELRLPNYYFAWGFVLLVFLLLQNLLDSRQGRALRAIHDHELAANATGVNTAAMKLQVFVISALLAAAAGSLLTHFTGGIGPSEAGAMKSVRYVSLVAVGGMGNLVGVLAASALLTFLSLRGCFGTYDAAVFGAILIAVVSLAPAGPFEPLHRWLQQRRAARAAARPEGGAHGPA